MPNASNATREGMSKESAGPHEAGRGPEVDPTPEAGVRAQDQSLEIEEEAEGDQKAREVLPPGPDPDLDHLTLGKKITTKRERSLLMEDLKLKLNNLK